MGKSSMKPNVYCLLRQSCRKHSALKQISHIKKCINQNVTSPALSHTQDMKGTLDTRLHDALEGGKFRENEQDPN